MKLQNSYNQIICGFKVSAIVVVLGFLCLTAPMAQCTEENRAFKGGEIVKFSAYYNWNFIWMNAGEVTFSTKLSSYKGQPAYTLSAIGTTLKGYDFFYSVRDTFEAIVDTLHLQPSYYKQSSNEGRYNSLQYYWFDYGKNIIKTSVKMEDKPTEIKDVPSQSCIADVLSMVYKTRNMDFSKYSFNDKIPITMILDGKVENLYVRYLGIETVKDRQERSFKCYKFSPLLPKNAIFDGGEEMMVWITTDRNRIPIIVEAQILIGSVKAVFLGAQNLKYPMESQVR